jgi:uncharacterized membrane protein YvbJ
MLDGFPITLLDREVILMKYCAKCGKELFDEAVICPGCGCPTGPMPAPRVTQNTPPKAQPDRTGLALLFAFLIPIVGLIMGIIGLNNTTDPKLQGKYKAAIGWSIVVWLISFIFLLMMMDL